MTCASVVLPVPGGPHKMMDEKSLSASMARRNSLPSPTICSCPMYLSNVRGPRMRPRGKRGFAFQTFVHGVVKEVAGHERNYSRYMKRPPFGGLFITCLFCWCSLLLYSHQFAENIKPEGRTLSGCKSGEQIAGIWQEYPAVV